MEEKYKKILKIWLVLYIIFTIFKIINIFNDSLLKSVFSIGTYPLEITGLILFVYVANRGEEKIGRYGIISIIVFFVFYILYKLSVYDLDVSSSASFTNKICSIIYYTSNNCISIFEYMAIFSLIKGNNKIEKYKLLALVGIVGFSLINLINNVFLITKSEFLTNIKYCLDYISTFAKYAAIIFYLTDDGYISNLFVNNRLAHEVSSQNLMSETNSLQQNVSGSLENTNQLMTQFSSQNIANVNQKVQQTPAPNLVNNNQLVNQQLVQNLNYVTQAMQQNSQSVQQVSSASNQTGNIKQ